MHQKEYGLIELKVKTPHVIAMIYSAQFMIEEKVESPYTDTEIVLLARHLESKMKNSKKAFKLKMNKQQAQMTWQFIDTVLGNEVVKNAEQLPSFFEAMEILAYAIDARTLMNVNPFELVK